jgi:hypothetical protein
MTRKLNEYETPEVLDLGAAQEIILCEKIVPFLDLLLEWPLFYRIETFDWCDES